MENNKVYRSFQTNMATLNYSARMSNLRDRRLDRMLNESTLSKSASAAILPEDIKYLIEAMQPVGTAHNLKSLQAAENVRTHLERDLKVQFSRAYATQGSVTTNTNIKVHSDFDLLVVIDSYFFPEVFTGSSYTKSEPDDDIVDLRSQSTSIMKNIYDEVNDKGEKGIYIYNKNLRQKVDLVFSFWYHSLKYTETGDDYHKGIFLYNFPKKVRHEKDFPFAMIRNVNQKGDTTFDGSRRAIRLLKTLNADSENQSNKLKSFQLTSIVHQMDDGLLRYRPGIELQIPIALSQTLETLIQNPQKRESVMCPKGIERPLKDPAIVVYLNSLKNDLDLLILDTQKDLSRSETVRKAVLAY